MLTNEYYTSQKSMHIRFPIKIKKSTNEANDIENGLIAIKNFFVHFVKEISITCYGNKKQLIPTFSPYETYQNSDAMLKHLPE